MCGHGFAQPLPTQDELDSFYSSGHYWHEPGGNAYQVAHENHQAKIRLACVLNHLSHESISSEHLLNVLDIGAGHGCIANWLQITQSISVGTYLFVEPDETNAGKILNQHADFRMVRKEDTRLIESDSLDLIFMNHVLEHVAAPRAFLAEAVRTLRPGGIAYVETPHQDFRFKPDVFPHLHFFSAASVRALVDSKTATLVNCETFGAWPGTPSGIPSLAHRLLDRMFRFCVDTQLHSAQHWMDDKIWRYDSNSDGIWIRWILRKL
jgi:2-polyprenyl-3-methyl-5-hydroxy-6-metoxy-1,4-benzoquinol methylase